MGNGTDFSLGVSAYGATTLDDEHPFGAVGPETAPPTAWPGSVPSSGSIGVPDDPETRSMEARVEAVTVHLLDGSEGP